MMKRLSFVLLVPVLFFSACAEQKSYDKPGLTKDQSFLALREEFIHGRYDAMLKMYAEHKGFFETNSKPAVLEMRREALAALVKRLNNSLPKSNVSAFVRDEIGRYGVYGIRYESPLFFTSGAEYEDLFKTRGSGISGKEVLSYLAFVERLDRKDLHVARVRRILALLAEERIVPKDRPAVIVRLMDGLSRRAGFSAEARGLPDRSLFPLLLDMTGLAGKEGGKADALSAGFLELAIARERNDAKKVRLLMEDLMTRSASGPSAAFLTYWNANKAYKERDREKALGLYMKAVRQASALSDADLLNCFVRDFSSADHFRQDITKRANVIRAEKAYERMMESHREIAVVTGDHVRLRQSMDARGAGNVITSLATGQKVLLLKKSEEKSFADDYTDYWFYVKIPGGHEGWVFGKYILLY